MPDPENLEKFVNVSFAELCESGKRVKAENAEVQKPASAEGRKTHAAECKDSGRELSECKPNWWNQCRTQSRSAARKVATAKSESVAPGQFDQRPLKCPKHCADGEV